jgi:hypothetical protein
MFPMNTTRPALSLGGMAKVCGSCQEVSGVERRRLGLCCREGVLFAKGCRSLMDGLELGSSGQRT